MPSAVVFQGTTSASVPTPAVGGRVLFANLNDGWALYVKLSNWTIEKLDATFDPLLCCGCSGGGWGSCTCWDVALCLDSDVTVQASLATFIDNYISTTVTLWDISDIDLTGLNINDGIQRDGANWVPVALSWGTDELVKISANDTTSGYLIDKVVPGVNNNVVLTELNDAGDEDLEVALNTTLTNMVNINTAILNTVNLNVTNPPTIPGLRQEQETPAGAIDGVNTVFALSFAPNNNILTNLVVAWVPQHPTVNYTVAGTVLTFTTAPITGPITATYFR